MRGAHRLSDSFVVLHHYWVVGCVLFGGVLLLGHIVVISVVRVHGALHVLIIPLLMELSVHLLILRPSLQYTIKLFPLHFVRDKRLYIVRQLLR